MTSEPRAVRPDLELTVADPEASREVSRLSTEQVAEVNDLRERFIPRQISNRSCDCARDVVCTLLSATASTSFGDGIYMPGDRSFREF